ncbi:MAG: HPF/RaiA family ribosome-associated protein [Cellvibrionaceae bacterium]
MYILVHANGLKMTNSLNEHIKNRIEFALSRFSGLITKIVVSVADENGPKGGVDKTCTVRIKTDQLSELIVKDTETDIYVAVGRAIARSKQSLTRHLQRAKLFDRKRLSTYEPSNDAEILLEEHQYDKT